MLCASSVSTPPSSSVVLSFETMAVSVPIRESPSSFVVAFRPDGHCSYESSGSAQEELTFSEYVGQSYESDVSEKFIEYLRVCCRASPSICIY